jgi:hypothetical protein
MRADDETIDPEDLALRRIARRGDTNMLVFDEGTKRLRVRSGAFVMDGDGCSVYLDSMMRAMHLTPYDVAKAPQNVVVSVHVEQVRQVDLGIRRDAWPPDSDGHPRDAAHALIVNSSSLSRKASAKARRALAALAVIL